MLTIHTLAAEAAMQGATSTAGAITKHTDGTAIGSNLEFSISPNDTLTCGLQGPGNEPTTLLLVDDHKGSLRPALALKVGNG